MQVVEDMKPLLSHLLCQVAIQFFIPKAKNDNNVGKRQFRDRTRESDFRRQCSKEEK